MVAEGSGSWQPLTRELFARLQRGQELRDRKGRVWTVVAAPFQEEVGQVMIIRSGDLTRRVKDRWADEYMLT